MPKSPARSTTATPPKAKAASGKKVRRPVPRQTFLVAATLPDGEGGRRLRVYAAVKRSTADALASVRGEVGSEVAVELTGKLSNRMAKTLGLKADEVRQI